ncbi:MAG: diguanylate cyclase [Elusimicrobiota bacterium]|nr:diguanylate cyclase [Elusimicrobiota bacterium]
MKRGRARAPARRPGRAPECAFEHLPVAATVTTARGRIRAVNLEARRLAGPWPVPGGARTCREYWGCRVAEKDCPLRRSVATGRVIRHALVHAVGSRGEETLVERVAPLPLPGGARGAVLVTGPATAFFRRIRRLRREAHLDPLTGLLNRRRFDALCARALAGQRRRDRGAFLMLDVDDLKAVNDSRGHAAGDRLLKRLGLILSANTRRGDIVGRVGGDEFAAFCPDTSPSQARELVRRLQRAMAADNAADPSRPRLSAQFGVAMSRPGNTSRLRALADARLRENKRRLHRGR